MTEFWSFSVKENVDLRLSGSCSSLCLASRAQVIHSSSVAVNYCPYRLTTGEGERVTNLSLRF